MKNIILVKKKITNIKSQNHLNSIILNIAQNKQSKKLILKKEIIQVYYQNYIKNVQRNLNKIIYKA